MTACHCPTCGRTLPKAKPQPIQTDTAGMSDSELYAHYKRIAPRAYLVTFLDRGPLSAKLRERAESLVNPTLKDLAVLHTMWRTERLARDRAWGTPAVGSPAWKDANEAEEHAA